MKTLALGFTALVSLGFTSTVYALPMVQGSSNCAEGASNGRLKCEACVPDGTGEMICGNCKKIGTTSDGTTIW